jgi:peptide chain release factor
VGRQSAVELIDFGKGPQPQTFSSVLLRVSGRDMDICRAWEGTILWIGQSMYRPGHKRKNWFVGIQLLLPPEKIKWRENDLRIETMRSSGPGGQHVNKCESGVRITHTHSGLSVKAQEERSQYSNRQLAMARLADRLKQQQENRNANNQQERWQHHNTLERGNPIKVFKGLSFRSSS